MKLVTVEDLKDGDIISCHQQPATWTNNFYCNIMTHNLHLTFIKIFYLIKKILNYLALNKYIYIIIFINIYVNIYKY